jgi:hypothetical protein
LGGVYESGSKAQFSKQIMAFFKHPKQLLISALVLMSLLVIAFGFWFGIGPGINLAKYSNIRNGMAYQDVDILLGGDGEPGEEPVVDVSVTWYDHPNGLTVVVDFDERGRVAGKHLIPPEPLHTLGFYR